MFNHYKRHDNPGFGIWFWIVSLDDMYFSVKELAEKHNHNRKRRFRIEINFCNHVFSLEIPYKHIGNKKFTYKSH